MKKKYWLIGSLCAVMTACIAAGCKTALDPYDDGKFGGSTNNESNELVTDKKIKLDGKLDDECWQNQKVFDFTYQNVRVRVKTVFGDLGFYVGYEVEDDHVYAVEGRDVWKGSSVEIYVDRGDATKKSERTFQYRLGALDQWELLYGYETKEDSWTATYLPVFGKTQVQGTVNSGSTQGMTAEIYVRWDALGYDFTSENFKVPETVKIMPVYNQSSGAEMDSARDFWVNNGGDLGNPMHYWLFDEHGFVDADAEGAIVGDSVYGRAKSAGWDVSEEAAGVIRSKTAGDQSIFFKNVYTTDYAVTTLIEYQDALEYWASGLYWQKDPYPKAGLILASDTTVQAYLLNYDGEHRHGTPEGMFFSKGNPDPRELWELYNPKNLDGVLINGAANGKLRMTGVKVGRYLLVFIGDAETERFGGTFVGMQEIAETAGNATPGFYTLGCEVEFSDYEVTTDERVITGLADSVLSVLRLDQKSGGALGVNQLGYKLGESATVTVNTYENYKLTSLKVNGEEKIGELSEDGELTFTMTENEMTVTPAYERVNNTHLAEGVLHYIEKNAPTRNIGILVTGTAADGGKVFLQLKPDAVDGNNNAEWYANLPDGTYKARVLVDGIYRATKEFTVNGANVDLSVLETPLNWVYSGDVETKRDGSVIVRGYNQYREVSNRTATDYFAMSAYHFRADEDFTVGGTWETGGFGVKIDNVVYRFHAMKCDNQEMYFYIEVDGGASQEYRGIYHSISGTGAPLQMDVFYLNGEFRILFDGKTSFVINADNTPNAEIRKLFDPNKTKRVGLITVGEDMVFQDYDFAFGQTETEAMYNRLSKGTVVLPQNVEGLQITSSVTGESATGTEVTLTFALDTGYVMTSVTVNGRDMLESVKNNRLTFTLLGGENIVTATAEALAVHRVQGTLGYAAGLYGAGDTVNISTRGFTGALNGESWSIDLPDGTHELKFESARFRTKTISVTVSGGNVTVGEKVEFTQIKFEDDSPIRYENETKNDFKIVGGTWTASYFAGITAGSGIRIDANIQRGDGKTLSYGDWQTGGLYIGGATNSFIVFVKSMENGSQIMIGGTHPVWCWWWVDVPVSFGGTGDNLDISFVYRPNSIALMLGERIVAEITPETVGTGEYRGACTLFEFNSVYREMFASDISANKVGLRIAHAPSDNADAGIIFKNVKCMPAAEIPADMKGSVKLPAAVEGLSVTAENNKLAGFVGETVTLNFNLDDGKTITSLTLDGNDVLNKLSGGKLVITLTAGEHVLEAATEGVSVFTVTGTLGYAAGLYGTGDTVTVSSGTFVGTLSGENWTIKLPAGDHEIAFASGRFETKTVSATVGNSAVSIDDKVEFTQIKFTADSHYERDGNDVLTPADAWTGAYFAGIDGKDGFRADIKLQREDGNFSIEGSWGTGGFFLKKNGVEFLIFVMRANSGEVYVYLQNKSNWTTYEYRGTNVFLQGTGAPVELSLVYLGDELHLLINQKAVLSLNVSNYTSGNLGGQNPNPAPYAGLFTKGADDSVSFGVATMDTGAATKIRYTKLAYSVVNELPNGFKTENKTAALLDNPSMATDYTDGSVGLGASATHWLKDPTGAGRFLTSDAQGNFVISYTLQRMDGNFTVEGTWDTPYFQIYINGTEYTFFAMRENANITVFYLNSATKNLEFRVPYNYRGTGAPLTIKVAFSSDDHLLHIFLADTHYAFEVTNAAGSSFETMYMENGKILGFRCGTFAGVLSDLSYAVTKAEVDTELQKWGEATKVSVTA